MKPAVAWGTCSVVSAALLALCGRELAWKIGAALLVANLLTIFGGGPIGWHTAQFLAAERGGARTLFLPGVACTLALYAIHFIR